MKKTPKQIGAIIALLAIFALIIGFIISAFQTNQDARNVFFAFYFAIIAIPILVWLCIFSIGRLRGKHTIAELFPAKTSDQETETNSDYQK